MKLHDKRKNAKCKQHSNVPMYKGVLKVHGPISQNGDIYSNDASSPKRSWFQISVRSVWKHEITYLPIPYCVSLIMVTITSHIFINIFQTVHFSAVKFTRGNGKNMSFLLIYQNLRKFEKIRSNRTGFLQVQKYTN